MPIFYTPPIHHPPILQSAMIHDTQAVEKQIFNELLRSNERYVLVKVGTYTLHNVQTHYFISEQELGRIMIDLGKWGIASRLVMSKSVPMIEDGVIYLIATRQSEHPQLLDESIRIKDF